MNKKDGAQDEKEMVGCDLEALPKVDLTAQTHPSAMKEALRLCSPGVAHGPPAMMLAERMASSYGPMLQPQFPIP